MLPTPPVAPVTITGPIEGSSPHHLHFVQSKRCCEARCTQDHTILQTQSSRFRNYPSSRSSILRDIIRRENVSSASLVIRKAGNIVIVSRIGSNRKSALIQCFFSSGYHLFRIPHKNMVIHKDYRALQEGIFFQNILPVVCFG